MARARVEYRLMSKYNNEAAEHCFPWETKKRQVESTFNYIKKKYAKEFSVDVHNLGFFTVSLSTGSTIEYWIEKHEVKPAGEQSPA